MSALLEALPALDAVATVWCTCIRVGLISVLQQDNTILVGEMRGMRG
jgi:hypothetical protein